MLWCRCILKAARLGTMHVMHNKCGKGLCCLGQHIEKDLATGDKQVKAEGI